MLKEPNKKQFKELLEELEETIKKFESNEIDLEDGIEKYKSAQEIIKVLKERLENTRNEIKEITK